MTGNSDPLKYLAAAMLLAILLWLPGWFYLPANGGDRFAPASALFTGLALAGVAISIWIQSRQERAGKLAQVERLDAQRKELRETLYSARLDTLIQHAEQFFESEHYGQVRGAAWTAIQHAMSDKTFRRTVQTFNHMPSYTTNRASGYYRDEDDPGGTRKTWNMAAHHIDDMTSFFAILSLHIRTIELLNLDSDARASFSRITSSLNVYWNWWGPCLRYVAALREDLASDLSEQADDADRRILGLAITPNLAEEFDRLDRYLLNGTSTNLESATGKRLLEAICRHHFCWSHCDTNGSVTVVPQPVAFEKFSLDVVGLRARRPTE